MAEDGGQQQQQQDSGDKGKQGSLLAGDLGKGGGDQAQQWASSLDEDTRGWVSSKAWDKLPADKALSEALKLGRSAEQKLGVPAEQLARIPKDENDAEGLKTYLSKLGVPEKPEGYEIKGDANVSTDFPEQAAKWFYEMNVPKNIAKGLYGKLQTYAQSTMEAAEQKFNETADKEINELKSEWKGEEFDKNVELARRVRATMGLSVEETMALERAIGVKRAATVFSSLGKALGEHRFVGGADAQTKFAMSPEAARTRIIDLQRDTKWMESYLQGDADKKAEWTRLHQIGFPDTQQAA